MNKLRPLAVAVMLACATQAMADNLLDVYHQAQTRDPVWASARANHDANIERLTQGRSLLLPSVDLAASTTKADQDARVPLGGDTRLHHYNYTTNIYSVQLTQPIYRKQNYATYVQGEAVAEQAESDLDSARQDLILRVTQAYLAVLTAQDALDFSRAEKSAIERLLALTKRNFSVGNAKLVDVHESQAAYDLADAQEIAAANQLEVRREALRVLTGASPGTLTPLGPSVELAGPNPANIEKWTEASSNNPQVKSAEFSVVSAKQEIEKNSAGHYPTLDFTAAHIYNDAAGSVQGIPIYSNTNQIGLVFQMPLYRGGGVSSRVREAAARSDQAEQQLELIRRQSEQQTREQYLAVLNGVARVQSLEQAQASNQRALESTVLGYERGLRTNIDIIRAQRSLFGTKRDLSQARYDYLFARLRLKAAVGQLTDNELEDVNRLLTLQDATKK